MNTFEERIHHFMSIRTAKKDTINAYMGMQLISYDAAQRKVTLSFPVDAWELNPAGNMHGGLICAALDITMGCICYVSTEAEFTPTIQMSVNFDKGIKEGSLLLVEGFCDHAGRRMAQARAIARIEGNEDIAASANGSYAINTHR